MQLNTTENSGLITGYSIQNLRGKTLATKSFNSALVADIIDTTGFDVGDIY